MDGDGHGAPESLLLLHRTASLSPTVSQRRSLPDEGLGPSYGHTHGEPRPDERERERERAPSSSSSGSRTQRLKVTDLLQQQDASAEQVSYPSYPHPHPRAHAHGRQSQESESSSVPVAFAQRHHHHEPSHPETIMLKELPTARESIEKKVDVTKPSKKSKSTSGSSKANKARETKDGAEKVVTKKLVSGEKHQHRSAQPGSTGGASGTTASKPRSRESKHGSSLPPPPPPPTKSKSRPEHGQPYLKPQEQQEDAHEWLLEHYADADTPSLGGRAAGTNRPMLELSPSPVEVARSREVVGERGVKAEMEMEMEAEEALERELEEAAGVVLDEVGASDREREREDVRMDVDVDLDTEIARELDLAVEESQTSQAGKSPVHGVSEGRMDRERGGAKAGSGVRGKSHSHERGQVTSSKMDVDVDDELLSLVGDHDHDHDHDHDESRASHTPTRTTNATAQTSNVGHGMNAAVSAPLPLLSAPTSTSTPHQQASGSKRHPTVESPLDMAIPSTTTTTFTPIKRENLIGPGQPSSAPAPSSSSHSHSHSHSYPHMPSLASASTSTSYATADTSSLPLSAPPRSVSALVSAGNAVSPVKSERESMPPPTIMPSGREADGFVSGEEKAVGMTSASAASLKKKVRFGFGLI